MRPPPLLAPVPRVAPLACLVEALRPALEPYVGPGDGAEPCDLWLSCGPDGAPLRWHCPVGVLYDLFAAPAASGGGVGAGAGGGGGPSPLAVLWEVGVHTGCLPRGELLPLGGNLGPRDYFFNAMKEAAFVLHGSSGAVQALLEPIRAALWEAAAGGDRTAHAASLQAAKLRVLLAGAPAEVSDEGVGRQPSVRVPVRAYLAPAGPTGESPQSLKSWDAVECVTVALDVLRGEGGRGAGGDGGASGEAGAASGCVPTEFVPALSAALGLRPGVEREQGFRVIVGGIEVPSAAEVAWVYSTLHFPDLWLHATVWVPPAPAPGPGAAPASTS